MYPWCSFVFVILLQTAVENKGSPPTWPYGEYTLLKPRTGCPAGWDDKGYIYQDTIDKNPSNNRSQTLHIDGKVACSHVKRHFCSKTNTDGEVWPSGQYCVYRHEKEKLHRMRPGSILMYNEKNNNKDEYKLTKFRVYIKKIKRSFIYMKLYFACQTSGAKKIPISLPITKPFYLLPYGSRDCQQVKWMVATTEWIKYHTNNYIKKGGKQTYGKVPYHELGNRKHQGITMFYCYYESCKYILRDKNGTFKSPGFPGKYPDGQLCSWRIMVPDNHTLRVRFTNFSLNDNDSLRYSKRINGSLRSWHTISLNTTVPFTLSADSELLFVFRWDESNNSSGFRAKYRLFIPQVPVTTPSTPSSTPSSKRNVFTTELKSSTIKISSTKASTPQPRHQDDKSNAESLKDSPFSSGKKGIVIIVIPAVSFLIGVVLLIMIIYQCRIRRTRSRARNSKRDTEGVVDRSVMNPTYERGDVLLNAPNETATALNIGDDSSMHQALSRDTPEYENIECEKLNKAIANRNSKNSEAKKSGSVEGIDHNPLYLVSEIHDPKKRSCPSQSETRESEALKDSGPNPLYHILEGPDTNNGMPEDKPNSETKESEAVKDSGPNPLYHVLEGPDANNGMPEEQLTSKSRESEAVNDSGPNPLYHVLERPDTNNGMPEDQPTSESRESESVKDSGPNPLYHVLKGPDPNNVGLAEDPTYEDVD